MGHIFFEKMESSCQFLRKQHRVFTFLTENRRWLGSVLTQKKVTLLGDITIRKTTRQKFVASLFNFGNK